MQKLFILVFVVVAIIGSSVATGMATTTRAATTSSCSLINPPNTSVDWKFYGNQGVWIYLKNGNILGVTARLGYYRVYWTFESIVLLPLGQSDEKYYSHHGTLPVSWQFELSTASDAAAIYGYAHWDSF